MSTNTTVSVRFTTDFGAVLVLYRLGDGASCVDSTFVDIIDLRIFTNVTAGDYAIVVEPDFIDEELLSCSTPGNYTLTLTNETIP